MESETPNQEPKLNREKVGQDLKLQWSLMMEEFEGSAKKQLVEVTPLCSGFQTHNN